MTMGSRGASSGIAKNGKRYGTEYRTIYQSGNIKFVMKNQGRATAPMETMTRGRVYATVNTQDQIKHITYYDKHNKRYKQIDVEGPGHIVNGAKIIPHTHKGYEHIEHGTRAPSQREWRMIERVRRTWYNYLSKRK